MYLPVGVVLIAAAAAGSSDLTVAEAISQAFEHNPTLAAGSAEHRAREAEARAAAAGRLPTFTLTGQATATSDPLAAFGWRLQERDVAAEDFAPDRLNFPGIVGSLGAGVELGLPLYTGGKLAAEREASAARASASGSQQAARRGRLALAVVGAYFRAQLAEAELRDAEATLEDARQTEAFTRARVEQQLLPQADAARASAHRAGLEAAAVAARQQVADARDELALLIGDRAREARLASPVEGPGAAAVEAAERPDVAAAREEEAAARAQAEGARAARLPGIDLQLRGGTLWGGGSALGAFATAGLRGRWDLFAPARGARTEAAEERAAAAAELRRWTEAQARTDLERARRAVDSARARLLAAREALAASESALGLRRARHREGLLPLTDLLDAQGAVIQARAAVRGAQLAERLGQAQLAYALGQPVEGVTR